MKEQLAAYKKDMEIELRQILSYWMNHTIDKEHGGFYGKINHDNIAIPGAPKGAVLNARILWAFAAAYRQTKYQPYVEIADRAFQYILNNFMDHENGGVYWSVDDKGRPLDTKKQVYALAFALYGFSEYYLATGIGSAKQFSVELFKTIEQYSYDDTRGGYFEAFTKDWQELTDLRLSKKDANERKTMNTHLHVLEAYTNLYRCWPDRDLKQSIIKLLNNFSEHIIDTKTGHLILFFDDNWNVKSDIISFGHDIEAAWLLQEAAERIDDEELVKRFKEFAVKIAEVSAEGLDTDGGLIYEKENGHCINEKHWWPQAEAMVGLYNAYQVSGEEHFLQQSIGCWKYVQEFILDKKNGEWFWGVTKDHQPMENQDKAGFWKCPYHNSRACLEIIRRIGNL